MKIKKVFLNLMATSKAAIRFLHGKLPASIRSRVGARAFIAGLAVLLLAIGTGTWALVVANHNPGEQSVNETANQSASKKSDTTTGQDQPARPSTDPSGADTPVSSTPTPTTRQSSTPPSASIPSGGGSSGSTPAQPPMYGSLSLSVSSVTLSKSGAQSAPITISAPDTVTTPGTSSQGSPVALANGAPSGTSFAMTVIMNPDSAVGTYSVPLQAIHNGTGTRYYTATLTVHIVD